MGDVGETAAFRAALEAWLELVEEWGRAARAWYDAEHRARGREERELARAYAQARMVRDEIGDRLEGLKALSGAGGFSGAQRVGWLSACVDLLGTDVFNASQFRDSVEGAARVADARQRVVQALHELITAGG